MTTTSPLTALPSAQVVGNAFVEQYYHILHQSPELVHRFYQNSSVVGRPGSDGVMMSVTTMSAINEMILSLDYKDCTAEIKTVDAQNSFKYGVVVLVTGCLTTQDNVVKKFTQSFFLAPQDKGYFVLNDVFRYVDENDVVNISVSDDETSESIPVPPMTPDPELSHVPDPPVPETTTPIVEEQLNNGVEVYDPVDYKEEPVVVELELVEELPVQSIQTEVSPITETAASVVQEDAPKKSYASILKVRGTVPTYVATNVGKPTAAKPTTVAKPSSAAMKPTTLAKPSTVEQQPLGSATQAPAPEASVPISNNASESGNVHEEVEGYSVYIKNLPLSATVAQVEEEFKKFGVVKPGGIQVRSNKGFCFGFVEFEALSSMQSAIESSSVTMGGRQVYIEEKRTTTRVGSGRGPYPPGRGTYRNDFRGRGNYGGGGRGGYGRNDYGNRGDFEGRRGPPSGRGGEGGYQRVDQNGNARGGRQGGMNQTNQTVVSAA